MQKYLSWCQKEGGAIFGIRYAMNINYKSKFVAGHVKSVS